MPSLTEARAMKYMAQKELNVLAERHQSELLDALQKLHEAQCVVRIAREAAVRAYNNLPWWKQFFGEQP